MLMMRKVSLLINIKSIDKGIKSIKKTLFLSNIELCFTVSEKVLNNFKNRLFPIKKLEPKLEQELEPQLEVEPKLKYRKIH